MSSTITSWYCDRSRCSILTTSRDNETPGHRSLISLNHPGLIASISSLPQVLAGEPVSCLGIRLKADTVGQLIVDKENKSANFFMWPNMFPYDTDRHFHSRCSLKEEMAKLVCHLCIRVGNIWLLVQYARFKCVHYLLSYLKMSLNINIKFFFRKGQKIVFIETAYKYDFVNIVLLK